MNVGTCTTGISDTRGDATPLFAIRGRLVGARAPSSQSATSRRPGGAGVMFNLSKPICEPNGPHLHVGGATCACGATKPPVILSSEQYADLAASEARAAALEAERDQYRAVVAAADDLARVLDQEVMPRYMEMIDAFGLGDSVVDPMSRQALDAYRDARAALAGQPAAPAIVCPDCLQSAPTAAEIVHGDGCEAAWCTEAHHIVLPSGEACVCGDNQTELLL